MKKLSLSLFCFIATISVFAQSQPAEAPKADPLQLRETSYDFGKIPQGKPVTHVFVVSNTGNEPLILENVQASCGCTTPEWTRDAIPVGGTKEIKVGFNAATEGVFSKNITIFYNKGQVKSFVIKGEVWKTPEQSAPKNNSVALLKSTN